MAKTCSRLQHRDSLMACEDISKSSKKIPWGRPRTGSSPVSGTKNNLRRDDMQDVDKLIQYCKESFSYAEVIYKFGLKPSGNNYRKLKSLIQKHSIDISHFTGQRWYDTPNKTCNLKHQGKEKYAFEEVFCKDSPVSQKVLRGYVKRHNVIPYVCSKCKNNGRWENDELVLELDHIDGDDHNNVPDNLRYLCPNCHSQTVTFRGRNKALKNHK